MSDDTLRAALTELVRASATAGVRLFLGGGYGLYLKQIHLSNSGIRTFLPAEAWPRPRGTPDLDIFLPTEIVVDIKHMNTLRKILDDLGYAPLETAKFMHFEKPVDQGSVRVELLTGPVAPEFLPRLRISEPRVRPKGDLELHAYLTNAAVALEEEPLSIELEDGLSVLIPNAFAFLVMKLHACRDRVDDQNKQLGRHHALDVYRILAMLSSDELDLARKLHEQYREAAAVRQAKDIVAELFADDTRRGVLRMKEHDLFTDEMDLEKSLELLHDLFLESEERTQPG